MAKILIACEESQTVCKAFREQGHEAFSCDLLPCSGGHPEWHLQMDAFSAISADQWDLMIAHPPCTYLTNAANRHFPNNPARWAKRLEAMLFVHQLLESPVPRIALENPAGAISTYIRKPDQYIEPYQFGHPESKKTGLWLVNLPALQSTDLVVPEYRTAPSGKRYNPRHWETPSSNNPENARLRSVTYSGIAAAMAAQWAPLL